MERQEDSSERVSKNVCISKIDSGFHPYFWKNLNNFEHKKYSVYLCSSFTFLHKKAKDWFSKNRTRYSSNYLLYLKFMFSKKATKIDEIFTVNLTFTTERRIDGEDFIIFCGLLKNHKVYYNFFWISHYSPALIYYLPQQCEKYALLYDCFCRLISAKNKDCTVNVL